MSLDFSPVWISLQTAAATMIIVFFAGILTAWWVISRRSALVKIIIDGVMTLPLVLPPTVAGFFLLCLFGNNRLLGRLFLECFGVQIAFSWLATVLAAAVIAFPLMYRSARGAFEQLDDQVALRLASGHQRAVGLGLRGDGDHGRGGDHEQVDEELLQAGRTLGMSESSIFMRVLLPNALPGIVSGGVLSFARGLGEFGATAMIAGNIAGKTRTLPLAVYSSVAAGDMDMAMNYVIIIMAVCLVMVIGMNWYLYRCRKRQEG